MSFHLQVTQRDRKTLIAFGASGTTGTAAEVYMQSRTTDVRGAAPRCIHQNEIDVSDKLSERTHRMPVTIVTGPARTSPEVPRGIFTT